MIIPSVNFLKSTSLKRQNQTDHPRPRSQHSISMAKKYLATSMFWRCSTFLVAGLTCLIMAHSATPVVAQPRIIEQYLDINNPQNVRAIQNALKRLGYSLVVDGKFGDETRAEILRFQRDNNLPVTGVVDNITANTLFARTEGIDFPAPRDGNRERFCRESVNRNQVCPYVVLIPGDNNRLGEIRRQLLASPYPPLAENLVLEDHSRGLFIRIDQYRDRAEAEVVANALRNNISPNFRVEYLPSVTPISSRG